MIQKDVFDRRFFRLAAHIFQALLKLDGKPLSRFFFTRKTFGFQSRVRKLCGGKFQLLDFLPVFKIDKRAAA